MVYLNLLIFSCCFHAVASKLSGTGPIPGSRGELPELIKKELFGEVNCSLWSNWTKVEKCIWITEDNVEDFPEECTTAPIPAGLPDILTRFMTAKMKEWYEIGQKDLKDRGATEKCGMCSHKAKCRNRTDKKDPFICGTIERETVLDDSCDVMAPCELTLDNKGGCSEPLISGAPTDITEDEEIAMALESLSDYFPIENVAQFGINIALDKLADLKREPPQKNGLPAEAQEFLAWLSSNPAVSHPLGELRGELGDIFGVNNRRRRRKRMEEAGIVKSSPIDEILLKISKKSRKEFINEWNCVKNKGGDKCLCCCGVYFPDPDSGECVDTTEVMSKYISKELSRIKDTDFVQELFSLLDFNGLRRKKRSLRRR